MNVIEALKVVRDYCNGRDCGVCDISRWCNIMPGGIGGSYDPASWELEEY